jgi:MFS family permease
LFTKQVSLIMSRAAHIIVSLRDLGKSTFSSMKVRNYRLYFIGQGISLSGTWMQIIGQSWLVLQITKSGTALGLVIALQYLPLLVLAPWGGVIADRFHKRHILYFTQSCSGLLALILAILVVAGAVRLWMIFVLAAALGLVNSIDNPTRQSFIHELAGREELKNAVSLNSTEVNLTRVIGPAIAAVVIATLGIGWCFFLNAGSFVAVLVCLLLMHGSELETVEPVERKKGQLREGLRYVWDTPVLRDVLIMMAIVGTLTYEFGVTLPLLARFTFHGNASSFALLTCSMGAGAVIGGLIAAGRKSTAPRGLLWAVIAFGLGMIVVASSPDIAVAMIAMALVGVFSIMFYALGNTVLQLESNQTMRGRVMSLWTVAFLGSTFIGGPVIGWIGGHASPRWAVAVGGMAAIAAGAFGLVAMRNYPSQKVPEDSVLSPPLSSEEDARVP